MKGRRAVTGLTEQQRRRRRWDIVLAVLLVVNASIAGSHDAPLWVIAGLWIGHLGRPRS